MSKATNIESPLPEDAYAVVKKLQDCGFEGLYAGGFVRDKLLGQKTQDIDIATNASPDDIERLFPQVVSVGKAFGVMIVVAADGAYEVATFREDGPYQDGRRPDWVQFTSREKDAHRRDFTVNGMYFDPVREIIFDDVGGRQDLDQKCLRFIGEPEARIAEDRLRMLRAVRFSARYDLQIDSPSEKAIKRYATTIKDIAVERVFDELIKMLRARTFRRSVELMDRTGLFPVVLPEIAAMKGVEQPKQFHPEGDVLEHTLQTLENLPENVSDDVLLAGLLHDVGKPPTQTHSDRIRFNEHDRVGAELTRTILRRFKRPNRQIVHVSNLVAKHMRFMSVKLMKVSTLKQFLWQDRFDEHLALFKADCLSSHRNLDLYDFVLEKQIELKATQECKPRPLMNGHDLIQLGMKPGPRFKDILDWVEVQQLEGLIRNRQQAREAVVQKFELKK